MKLTRQLRLDALAADGTAPIQLTITWERNRLRVGTGAVARPAHWDERTQLVKVQHGTAHASVNPRLNRAGEAAAEALATARKQGRRLAKPELVAAVQAALALTPVAAPPAAPDEATDFDGLQRRWILEQVQRPRGSTGKAMSKTARAGFEATRERFGHYAKARGKALRVETIDLEFYHDFRTYMLDELGQEVNTFGKHISRLKAFLAWAEAELDLPVHRHYRRFVAATKRGAVDALTEQELLQVAAIDFGDPATRAELLALRLELGRSTGKHQDDAAAEAWLSHVELARDKFLLCCYTSLRISDAERVAWQHVRGNLIVLDDTAKNGVTVYIPFFDDEVFKPVALASRYEHRSLTDLLVPACYRVNEFLRVVQRVSGITRLHLTSKIGRKTFVTLKLYAGVASRLIMQATGHQTEAAFNHYVGVDELKIVEEYMRKSARRRVA